MQAGAALRFVIQKHAARRLHYDLRLELDGAFRSWAVTRGPSINPADKRLAVQVEDHPLEYGDFEGTIPAGQYGGGTVQIWDRGYWRCDSALPPREALAAGELKFTLEGERLQGSWVLVRLRTDRSRGSRAAPADSAKAQWLLIKHRDAGADPARAEALLAQDRSVASGRSMAAIAAGRKPAPAPFMQSAKPKASSRGPMPRFIPPQLCTLVTEPPESPAWGHEIKLDGYRLQLHVQGGRVRLLTRKGLDWTDRFGALARAAARLPDCIIDGELVAVDAEDVPDFAELQAAISEQRTDGLVFFAFDLLYESSEDLRPLPLTQRKQRLQSLLSRAHVPGMRYLEHITASGAQTLQSACRMHLEGIVSKRLDAPYRSGRVGTWTKAKCRAGQEVVIGGYTLRGGAVRSLLVGTYRARALRYVGRVGTGFGERIARPLLARLKSASAPASPFAGANAPRGAPDVHWVKPELVAEIEFAGWTEAGMVRQAAFKGLREDKPPRSVEAEHPAAPPRAGRSRKSKAAPVSHRASRGSAEPVEIGGVRISQPQKTLWPDAGDEAPVSKLDLARYYEAIGEWMLEHVAGRPCSLLRAPDGIEGPRFFQRHAMPGQSDRLSQLTVSGDHKPYLVIEDLEGLLATAQSAALELHPWNCAPHEPEVPERLVFDLDPAPEVEFGAVIAAALELRERLAKLGLATFCKSTGGKGLHVVAPLIGKRDRLDWPAAKMFAQAVCTQMSEESPSRYLVNMSKRQRTGRIFLDYLRNDRTATAVAPLSARARPGATVSMPLLWSQVRAGLDPVRYTVRTAPQALRGSRPWRDYAQSAGSLRAAIARFTGQGRKS